MGIIPACPPPLQRGVLVIEGWRLRFPLSLAGVDGGREVTAALARTGHEAPSAPRGVPALFSRGKQVFYPAV